MRLSAPNAEVDSRYLSRIFLTVDERRAKSRFSFFLVAHFLLFCGQNEIVMGKQEMFNKVLTLIEEETEVSRDLILSGNKQEEVVDARALLIYTLHELGFYPPQISAITGICNRCINPYIVNFGERKTSRKMLRIYYDRVKRKIRECTEFCTS